MGVHHIEGHILANALTAELVLPAMVLVVSGGHTELVHMPEVGRYERLGGTVDDAAGEAFDKSAKLLGLPYPGGPHIDRLAAGGEPRRFGLPRPLIHDERLIFSFSGLKTAVRLTVEQLPRPLSERDIADVCRACRTPSWTCWPAGCARRRGGTTSAPSTSPGAWRPTAVCGTGWRRRLPPAGGISCRPRASTAPTMRP